MNKILVINDLAVTSKVAGSINNHILANLGFDVNLLPSILYSSHLAFKEVITQDTSSFLKDALSLYKKNNIRFNAIYVGLLVNNANIDSILDYIKDEPIYLDPILGDNGRFYSTITKDYLNNLKKLIAKSYLITPNLFEACSLLNIKYQEYKEEDIKLILKDLTKLGPKVAIITGVTINNLYGAYLYDSINDKYIFKGSTKLNYYPHGTGDLFSSLFTGLNLKFNNLAKALEITIDILHLILEANISNSNLEFGLDYEETLNKYLKKL